MSKQIDLKRLARLRFELQALTRGEFDWRDYTTVAFAKGVAHTAREALALIAEFIEVPKWEVGQRFAYRETGQEFQITQLVVLEPDGRIGYCLKPAKDVDHIGILRRFGDELERDFMLL